MKYIYNNIYTKNVLTWNPGVSVYGSKKNKLILWRRIIMELFQTINDLLMIKFAEIVCSIIHHWQRPKWFIVLPKRLMRIDLRNSTFFTVNIPIYYLYVLYFTFSENFGVLRNSCKSSLVVISVHVDVHIPKLTVVVIPDKPIPTVKCYQNVS